MKNLIFKAYIFFSCTLLSFIATGQPHNSNLIKNAGAAGLSLPPGFSATIAAENLPGARHITINKQGGIYIKLSKLKDGKGIVYLKDNNGDGAYKVQSAFGDYPGTGIVVKNEYLYASSNNDVYRYKLDANSEVLQPDKPEKIIAGLVNRMRDNSKAIAVDNINNIYVNVGSYLSSCLTEPGSKKAPYPCPLLDSVGGIWQFKTDKLNQQYSDGVNYATGFKNVVGIDWNKETKSLFIMQHNRDNLNDLFPELYTKEQGNLVPAETMYEVVKGSNGGWPYVYYDQFQHKKILNPEYGGDGKKSGDDKAMDPTLAFPAHLAADGLLFYTGSQFPKRYKNGAFIAFHGKSPELQKGYFVAFVPFKKGKPSGDWEIFADNFSSGDILHKPCGLAMAPDGSLFVTDDAKGTVYQIRYHK